jgi:CHASE2 domain-containing sensor protein
MLPKLEEVFLRSKKARMVNLFDLTQFAVCILIIGVHIFILNTARLEPIENGILSYFFKHRPPAAAHPEIVLVEIDQETLDAAVSFRNH